MPVRYLEASADQDRISAMNSVTTPVPIMLTVRSVTTRAIAAPLNIALGTSVTVIRTVPLLLVDLQTEEGIVGRAYLFSYTPAGAKSIALLLAEAVELVKGQPSRPQTIYHMLVRRLALLGVAGPVRMAISALDSALWDVAAKAAGLPLVELLGASRRPIRAYDSRGLGLMPPDKLVAEAETLLRKGMRAIKLRLGHPTLDEDLAALRALRGCIPREVLVMVDYNQALTTAEAIRRGLALQAEGIAWLEEPIHHDDYQGNAQIARTLDVPLQIGENFNGPEAMAQAFAADACDYVMPDVGRIGGVTGWMQAAAIAAARGVEMSSHLVPEVSVHLLAATPTAHWLEYVDWADAILEEPLQVIDGAVTPSDRPGVGLEWDEAKLRRLSSL
jgi:mandelate racemase